jgi:hypothetical protein
MATRLLIVCCFFLLGCSKNNIKEDNVLPAIQLVSPANNQTFTGTQTVAITGTITDNDKLAELHVHISNNTTGQLLIDIHRYPSAAVYSLSETFQVQSGINYKIQVIVTDKSANQKVESVLITVL